MKGIHQEERKALLQDKKTHSLQVKGLFNRAGIDPVKRLKIMDQLQKRLK